MGIQVGNYSMIYSQQSSLKVDKNNEGVERSRMYDDTSELAGLRDLNPETISAIHNRYFSDIYRFALYRIGDETIAEDISSEAFTRLLEAVHARRGPKSNIKGWLIGTTSNLVNDYFRNKYAHQEEELSGEYMAETDHDPMNLVESKFFQAHMRAAVNELTIDQQQVITLRFSGGFSLEETAQVMGKKINAIKALQFRALASLRKMIGDVTV
jgi:RNA polymerase sigma-70 factor (ECF subfamily)